DHRVLMIRLNHDQWRASQASTEELYERTRASWKVAPERRKPEWVFGVYDGIVRAVYRIEDWEQAPDGRWAFCGVRDPAMEDRYLWSDVSGYLRRGAQNPVTYVNCHTMPRTGRAKHASSPGGQTHTAPRVLGV